jgi:hypothetical protein
MLDQRVLVKHPHLRAAGDWVTALVVVVFAGAMIYLLFSYENGGAWVQRVDEMLSYRLKYTNNGLLKYGVHPFGSRFELIGAGRTTGGWIANYNFIDCSFHLILIRYGYIMLVAVLAIWVFEIRTAQKSDDRRLALVLALIAFHSISEHHLIDMYYNIALSMPLAMYGVNRLSQQGMEKTAVLQN